MKKLILILSFAALAFADVVDKSSEHKSFAGVHELIIDNVNGFIEVTGTSETGTVELDVAKTLKARSQDRLALAKKEVKLDVTQEGGLLRLRVEGRFRDHGHVGYEASFDFKVRVPRDIHFEIDNVNGTIDMRDMDGSGDARTVNGSVKAVFAQNPKAPLSFRSVNGTLDVTFRPDLNANARMTTVNGGVYTDFPVSLAGDRPEQRDGKFVWRSPRLGPVRIGNGGPELRFETVNGDVLIKNRER